MSSLQNCLNSSAQVRCLLKSKTICYLLAMFSTPMAYAAENPMNNPGGVLAQTLLGLLLVVGVIFCLAFFAKKLNLAGIGHNKGMKIVSSLNLSAREKAVLIEVGDQQILLGVAPGRVNAIHSFEEPVIIIEPETPSRSKLAASSASEFSKKLNEFLKHGNKTQ